MPPRACCSLQSLRRPPAAAEEAAVVDTPTPSPRCTAVTQTTPRRPRQPFLSLSTSLRTCHTQKEGPRKDLFPCRGCLPRRADLFRFIDPASQARAISLPCPLFLPAGCSPAFYLHSPGLVRPLRNQLTN